MPGAIHTDVSSEADDRSVAGAHQNTEVDQQATQDDALRADLNPRTKAINEMAAKWEKQRAVDLGYEQADPEPEAQDIPVAQDAPPVRDERPAPVAPADLPVHRGTDGQYYMKLKVNGREQDVLVSKVQATMQKHEAADQRLQHASQLERDAQARQRRVQEHEARLQTRLQPPGEGAATSDESRATARSFIDKLLDSEPDQAAESLARLFDSRTPQIDVARLKSELKQEVVTEAQQQESARSLDQALRNFGSKYSRIVEDSDLFVLADQKTVEIMREKPYLTHQQVLDETGEYITQKFLGGVKPAAAKPDGSERQNRKNNLKPIPRGSSQATPRAQEPEPATPASVVANMRRARGLGN